MRERHTSSHTWGNTSTPVSQPHQVQDFPSDLHSRTARAVGRYTKYEDPHLIVGTLDKDTGSQSGSSAHVSTGAQFVLRPGQREENGTPC